MNPPGLDGDETRLRQLALRLRLQVLEMTRASGASHIGTNYSIAELLAVLYGHVLRVDPDLPRWPDRDRFVLSKGHGCAALYAVLAERGFFPREWLDTFYRNGGRLPGHATHTGIPGVEVSTGSLGHGLSIATGMALAARRDQRPHRVYCLLSDGECDEGSTWEPVLFAAHHRLDNLVAVVDYNKIQSLGATKDILDLEPFADKWRAFGWATEEVDGHDVPALLARFARLPFSSGRPSCLIAHTVKGKGVSFMEGTVLWHYRSPQGDEYRAALAELEAAK